MKPTYVDLPAKEVERRRAYQREWQRKYRETNPGAAKERSRKHRAKNPTYARNWKRRADGLPEPTRVEPEWCECCGRLPGATMHLDHDHRTGEFRGWLCGQCNLGLGALGDDAAGLEKALAYLRRV